MKQSHDSSSYSRFRKKRASVKEINARVGLDISEIDQMSKELENLSRNRKVIALGASRSGNSSISNDEANSPSEYSSEF